MNYLLDTDICSFFLRGKGDLKDKFDEVGPENIFVSRITYTELMVLATRRKFGRITVKSVQDLMELVRFVDVSDSAWDLFPAIKGAMLGSGKPLGLSGNFDILQACIATTNRMTMVSHNTKDYEAIASVNPFQFEDWMD